MNKSLTSLLFIIPSLMCLVAAVILELPEVYYTILRIVVFIAAIGAGYLFWRSNKKSPAVYPYAVTAIVFNPIYVMPIPTQAIWIVADVIAIIIFLGGLWVYRKEHQAA